MASKSITHSYSVGKSASNVLSMNSGYAEFPKMFVQTPAYKDRRDFKKKPKKSQSQFWTKLKNTFYIISRLAAVSAHNAKVFVLDTAELSRHMFRKARCAVLQARGAFSIPRSAGVALLSAAVVLTVSTSFVGVGLQVYVDGAPVGFVANQDDFLGIVSDVEERASNILGYPYLLESDIEYRFEVYNKQSTANEAQVEQMLFNQIEEIAPLYVLTVDGEVIGATTEREPVDTLLSGMLHTDDAEAGAQMSFLRQVELDYAYTNSNNLRSVEEISAALGANVCNETQYTVREGDLFSDIAARFGMSQAALQALNPGTDANRIIDGDLLVVSEAIPLMSIQKVRQETYEVAIPFETEYIEDSSMYVGSNVTETAGAAGSKTVSATVTYVDGRESSRTILSELVNTEPVTEVVRKGTMKRLATGTFIQPCRGTITSRFGGRIFRGSYDYHTGLDFATSKGTNIVASDGGTVTFAGYKGNYGYLVIINHGNGFETYYAHCSKLLVSVGQKVGQGELIAKVGSTGKSTGSHCHLEIRINGSAVNPEKYLWK